MLRRSLGFDSRSVSRRNSGTRPTWARQTAMRTLRVPIGASTSTPSTLRTGSSEPRMALVVLAIGRPRAVKCLANVLTFAGALHAVLTELREQQHGVLARRFPEFGVQGAEEGFDPGLPGPEQVVSELLEFLYHRI